MFKIYDKIHQFLSSIERHAHKRNLVPFLPHGVLCNAVGRYKPERYQIFHSLVRRHVQGAMAHGGIYDGDFFVGIYCFMADEFLKSVGIWQRCGQEYDGTVLTNIVPCF